LPAVSRRLSAVGHDGYRLMARRDPVGIGLITSRFPLVIEAVNHLKARSCLIDGEVVCCDERGLSRFDVLRRRSNERTPSPPAILLCLTADRRACGS
jgi:bifunctional non-homologous end joining protein LigD